MLSLLVGHAVIMLLRDDYLNIIIYAYDKKKLYIISIMLNT